MNLARKRKVILTLGKSRWIEGLNEDSFTLSIALASASETIAPSYIVSEPLFEPVKSCALPSTSLKIVGDRVLLTSRDFALVESYIAIDVHIVFDFVIEDEAAQNGLAFHFSLQVGSKESKSICPVNGSAGFCEEAIPVVMEIWAYHFEATYNSVFLDLALVEKKSPSLASSLVFKPNGLERRSGLSDFEAFFSTKFQESPKLLAAFLKARHEELNHSNGRVMSSFPDSNYLNFPSFAPPKGATSMRSLTKRLLAQEHELSSLLERNLCLKLRNSHFSFPLRYTELKLKHDQKKRASTFKLTCSRTFDFASRFQKFTPKFNVVTSKEHLLLPHLCEEVYVKPGFYLESQKLSLPTDCLHLVILVHGLMGSVYDVAPIKNRLLYLDSSIKVVCFGHSSDQPMDVTAARMAENILEFLGGLSDEKSLTKLSFIGFSLGGVLLRAVFPYLGKYASKFHTFISIGSPHLGSFVDGYSFKGLGVWVMKKLTHSTSPILLALDFQDKMKFEETFLYKLSKNEGLKSFKFVTFIGAKGDKYSHWDSAVVSSLEEENLAERMKANLNSMVNNILEGMNAKMFVRTRVLFRDDSLSVDTFIGRHAHIQMIENLEAVMLIIDRYEFMFI